MLSFLATLPNHRGAWGLLLISALVLLIAALIFQYALNYPPCLLCIYIRVAVCVIALAAFIAWLNPNWLVLQLVGWAGWLGGAIAGAQLCWQLFKRQTTPASEFGLFGASCDYIPNFPSWLALHQWWPSVFQPQGSCNDQAWYWLGLSMAQWTLISFIIYLLVAALILTALISQFKKHSTA